MSPPISEARKRANDNYLQKLDEIKIRVPKGRKADVQAHAEALGESVNAFINRAISETMERDKAASMAADSSTEAKEEDTQ